MRCTITTRKVALLAMVVATATFLTGDALAEGDNPYQLKPGAKGQVCLGCHTDFEDTMQRSHVHTPVQAGECSDCHAPHASSHGKLLAADPNAICAQCHSDLVPETVGSIHDDVTAGNCVACHDPHASDNPKQLVATGNQLCFGCHDDLAGKLGKVRFRHSPVEDGCLNCHDPHASSSPALLADTPAAVCGNCHDATAGPFLARHQDYPVAEGRCSSCHDPHGSDNPGILWATVHRPVANRQCSQCHNAADSEEPLGLRSAGVDTCRGCHREAVGEILNSKRIHWPTVSEDACLTCHGPHATSEPALLEKPLQTLCGDCHSDTIERQATSATKHAPVNDGECVSCHSPHGSDHVFLLAAATGPENCGTCHEWKGHSAHPIGTEFRDPRNGNLDVDCASCHRSHGSPFLHFTPYDVKTDLCVECHEQLRR